MSEVKRDVCYVCIKFDRSSGCNLCDPDLGWRKELDAQRLRADTAERALANCNLALKAQTFNFETQKAKAAAAEQRIAEHESMLRHFANCADLLQVGTTAMNYVAALNPSPEPVPAPYSALKESYDKAVLLLHKWINNNQPIAETIEFLNPNPEAENHE